MPIALFLLFWEEDNFYRWKEEPEGSLSCYAYYSDIPHEISTLLASSMYASNPMFNLRAKNEDPQWPVLQASSAFNSMLNCWVKINLNLK